MTTSPSIGTVNANDGEPPRCDKCGLEITTGLMAAFCPYGLDCELHPGPESEESIAEFRELFGIPQPGTYDQAKAVALFFPAPPATA